MGSKAGISISKDEDFSEWYTQVVLKAELADYAPVKGLMVLRPDGYSIWESLKNSFDRRFARIGIRNGFLPILIPESLLGKEQKHFEGFNPEVFWVTHSGTNQIGDRLALRPTSETLAYTMYAKWIQSWRDLPLKINFWNTALRAEIKATRPFLRTSEFLWQEGHTVHATKKEAEDQVMQILEIYRRTVEEELAIPVMTGTKTESEKFVGAVYTTTMESIMPDGRALQMGTSHFLGQNFSKPFEVKFADRDNVEHFAWQTSWGVSWRLIGAMIMVHGDNQGLVMPPRVAPIQVVIVPIHGNDTEGKGIATKAQEIKNELEKIGIRVHVDVREGISMGYKFNDWEMKGVPVRIEIGPKEMEKQQIVVATRHDGKKTAMGFADLADMPSVLDTIQDRMLASARAGAQKLSMQASGYAELTQGITDGMSVRAAWCGSQHCEEEIKQDTGADIRLVPFDSDTADNCIKCGQHGRCMAVFARGY